MPEISRTDARHGISRNNSLFDLWSIVHFLTGVVMGSYLNPILALGLMIAWEPVEILVLSPPLGKRGILFGHESLRNSLSDIIVDALGILAAVIWIIPR